MSHSPPPPTQHQPTSLSLSARLLCYLGPPSAILLTSLVSPKTGLLSPLAFLPAGIFFHPKTRRRLQSKEPKNSQSSRPEPRELGAGDADLEPLLWTYVTTAALGPPTAVIFQGLICLATARILFPSTTTSTGTGFTRREFWTEFQRGSTATLTLDELSHRAQMAASWQNWTFNLVLTFLAAGLVEEVLKYLPVVYSRYRKTQPHSTSTTTSISDAAPKPQPQPQPQPQPRRPRNRATAYLNYALAGALGFNLVENIGFLHAAAADKQGTSFATWPAFLLTVVERVGLGSVGHVLAAALTALRAARVDEDDSGEGKKGEGEVLGSWKRGMEIIGPSVIMHGAFDFVAMSASAAEGNVGWIHPQGWANTVVMGGLCVGIVGVAGWMVRREWRGVREREKLE